MPKLKIKDCFIIPEVQKIGIYAIHNNKTNKYYIGSSVNVYKRMIEHARKILKNRGLNKIMRQDIKTKKDFKNFNFIILETFENNTITDKELRKIELDYIRKYDAFKNGYNLNGTYTNGQFELNEKLICKEIPTRKATANYQSKFDLIQIRLPKGTKEKIKNIINPDSVNNYIVELIEKDLEQKEKN